MTNPAIAKTVLYWFPLKRRATAMGVKQTGIPLSGALAASILPTLAIALSWRFAMAALGAAVVAAALTAFILYRDPPTITRQHARKPPDLAALKAILMNKNTWLVCGLAASLIAGQYCIVTYLILYLRDALHLSLAVAGMYLAAVQMTGLVARVCLGMLSDFGLGGRRKVVMIGCGFVAVSLLSLTGFLNPDIPGALLVLLMAGLGICIIGWHGVFVTILVESTSVELAGTAVGFGSMLVHLAAVFAPALFGWIVDQTGSYSSAWFMLAGLALLGSLLLTFGGRESSSAPA